MAATPSADVSGPEKARSSRCATTSARPPSRSGRSARASRSRRPRRGGAAGSDTGGAWARSGSRMAVVMPSRSRTAGPCGTVETRGGGGDPPTCRRYGQPPRSGRQGTWIGTANVPARIRPTADRRLSDVLPRRGHRDEHAAMGRAAQRRALVPARALHGRARDLPRRAGRRGRRAGHGPRRAHARRAHRAPRRPAVGLPGGDRARAATASTTSASARSTTTPTSPATASRATSWPSRPGCRPAAGSATSTRRPSCPATSS